MNMEGVKPFLISGSREEIAARLVQDLDRVSPLMGARGPTDPGPEEPYVLALVECDKPTREKTGLAVNALLLAETAHAASHNALSRPLLVFNLLSLLEGVRLADEMPSLSALRSMRSLLKTAMADRNEDLYRRLLLALAENQKPRIEKDFWSNLLAETDAEYVDVAVKGLRASGWMVGLETLHEVKDVLDAHPELGDFAMVVMLLINEHPEARWPDCAKAIYGNWQCQETWKLILKYSTGRYEEPLRDVARTPGSALDDIYARQGNAGLDDIDRQEKQRKVSPSCVLTKRREREAA
jgi:hypothetical protein